MGSRRSNGEGSIRYRPKEGRWIGQVQAGTDPVTGRPRRKSVYGRTRKEVANKLAEVRPELASSQTALRVEEAMALALSEVRSQVDEGTYLRYVQQAAPVIEHLGKERVGELTALQVTRWMIALEQEYRLSASKRKRAVASLKRMMKRCAAMGLVRTDVVAAIALPRYRPGEVRPLTRTQVAALLNAVAGRRQEPFIWLALDSGARRGEMWALTWDDVDLDQGEVFFSKSLKENTKGQFRLKTTKTVKGRRRVPITAETVKLLGRLAESQRDKGLPVAGPDARVFRSLTGGYILASNFTRQQWKPLAARAGVPEARLHDLRHTCATLLLLENVHPKVVSERLGHSRIEITLNTYSHLLPGMQQKATEALSRVLVR